MGTRVATGERRPATSKQSSNRQAAKSSPGEVVSFVQGGSYSSQRSCRQRQRQPHKRREHSERQTARKSASRADERRAEPRSHRPERRRRADEEPKPAPNGGSNNNGGGETNPSAEDIPENQLKQLAKEILDQTKQLGFFDEVRMLLLEQIESSNEFRHVQEAFGREVERFCSRADLSMARPKLRDQLQAETFADEDSALSRRLKESIDRITYECTREKLRPLFNEHATSFLEERHYVIKQQQPSNVITTATTHIAGDEQTSSNNNSNSREPNHRELSSRKLSSVARDSRVESSVLVAPGGNQPQEPEQEQLSSSCCSSHADSGFSLSPPPSARENHNSRPPRKSTETSGIQPAKRSEPPDRLRSADKTAVISTAVAMAAIMMGASGTRQPGALADKGQPKDRLAVRYARRRERRIKRKANRRRLRAQLLDSRRSSA